MRASRAITYLLGMIGPMHSRWRRLPLPRWFKVGSVLLLGLAALFYLFVVPILVAANPMPGVGGIAAATFGAFMLFQVWLLLGIWAWESLETLYQVRLLRTTRVQRFLDLLNRRPSGSHPARQPRARAITTGLMSFLLTTYAFGVIYLFISERDPKAFGAGPLEVFDAFYYGFATSVTYGDLNPTTDLARALVLLQLATTLAYTLFLFSTLGAPSKQLDDRE